ncbi:nicotinamide riboside transporter PnuC [Solitalea canadensis]|uniref:Nicotinamide riboside transporter PnuC n=1 Tax=Solitalea canadensis (strain ATCC 29591 / DSM 3403 / JCM 21819 / LMG 8368 / NBRC 15130 / NCIMB 12057 / USAM 9D) TaxID=929556 RepID=H8KSG8_SOLCM|nr:nicotinamide riboside transporter PnuC [Solitalea canadensis]AFD08519.1 nicotinamide mononucleotide transporter PnuC [Solitalea canadensis DSM 3403]
MNIDLTIEIVASLFSILYLWYLMKEKVIAWPFGILASLLSIYLFMTSRLYSESILNSYYVLMGFYGWWQWNRPKTDPLPVSVWNLKTHIISIGTGLLLSAFLGYFFHTQTNADYPYVDATITIFSFIATYKESRKILSAWPYWIIINTSAIMLYIIKGLYIYAALMALYDVMSVFGYRFWLNSYHQQQQKVALETI